MKKVTYLILIITINFSCKKNHCKIDSSPTIEGDTEVVLDGVLELEASGNKDFAYEYLWTGPNNFEYYGSNINMDVNTLDMAGEYSVVITDSKNCESEKTNFNLIVRDLAAPCDIDTNYYHSSKLGTYNLSYITVSDTNDTDDLLVKAGGVSGEIVIRFNNSGMPKNGIYSVSNEYSFDTGLYSYEVSMYYHSGNIFENHYANQGEVFVKVNDGILSISFCSIHFVQTFDIDISANILKEW